MESKEITTSCKNCCFAVYDDKTQIGCLHNRIEKFGNTAIDAYDDDLEFYVIKRLCNYYRDKAWGYSEQDIEKVTHESSNSYAIFIDCNEAQNKIDNLINYIRSIDYYQDKITITLFHDSKNFHKVKNSVEKIARNCGRAINISVLSEGENNFLHNKNKNDKHYFHCVIRDINLKTVDFPHKINSLINSDLSRCFAVEYLGNLFINNNIYKALAYFKDHNMYDEVIEDLLIESYKLGRYIKL